MSQNKREMILQNIDDATHPDKMSSTDAIDFLEELSADLDGRIDALRDENDL